MVGEKGAPYSKNDDDDRGAVPSAKQATEGSGGQTGCGRAKVVAERSEGRRCRVASLLQKKSNKIFLVTRKGEQI